MVATQPESIPAANCIDMSASYDTRGPPTGGDHRQVRETITASRGRTIVVPTDPRYDTDRGIVVTGDAHTINQQNPEVGLEYGMPRKYLIATGEMTGPDRIHAYRVDGARPQIPLVRESAHA